MNKIKEALQKKRGLLTRGGRLVKSIPRRLETSRTISFLSLTSEAFLDLFDRDAGFGTVKHQSFKILSPFPLQPYVKVISFFFFFFFFKDKKKKRKVDTFVSLLFWSFPRYKILDFLYIKYSCSFVDKRHRIFFIFWKE